MNHTTPIKTASRWSGALRRKLAGSPEFETWLEQAAQDPVTPARIDQWFLDAIQAESAEAIVPLDTLRKALRDDIVLSRHVDWIRVQARDRHL